MIKRRLTERFSVADQVHFAKRLSFLISGGVPILESLKILEKQTKSKGKKTILHSVVCDISDGKTLSESLGVFPHVFDDFALNLIAVGESGGILEKNLEYLAFELEKKQGLRRKLFSAFLYPSLICLATLSLSALLTVYIFPKIVPIFRSLKVALPASTRFLMWLSVFLRNWGILSLFILFCLVITFFVVRSKVFKFRFFLDRLILRLPFVGGAFKNYAAAHFSRTLGLLLKSDVSFVHALAVTAGTLSNEVYKKEFTHFAKVVAEGGRLSREFEREPKIFPDTLPHLVAIGETTGNLSQTFLYLSELYEREVDDFTKNLSSLVEPALMIVMGGIVAFVAISVITPIYEITSNLHH